MPETIIPTLIEKEMKESYLDYSMSVIVGRALPDIRDGLKPVHRRILYAMHTQGLTFDKKFRKCADVVGTVLGKFHPHGDQSVYDALVRMAQTWSLRYPLVWGQGNMGCFTGDTKIKLLDGSSKSFKELCETYKNGELFYVYSVNKNGDIVVGEARNPRLTKKDAGLVEVTFDTGEKIRCTPDHRFLLKDGSYKQAKELSSEDSLMPGYFKLSPIRGNTELKDYLMVKDNKSDEYVFVHEITDKYNLEKGTYSVEDGPVRHHINFNKFNNTPENLKRLSWKEHTAIHNEHIKKLWNTEEFRKKQSEGVKKFYKNNPEHIENLRKRIILQNKDKNFIKKSAQRRKELWKSEIKRKEISVKIKDYFSKHPERKESISRLSKEMWADSEKRDGIIKRIKEIMGTDLMSVKLSEMQINRALKHPEIADKISKQLKKFYKNNQLACRQISERSKALWKDDSYRAKFINEDHNHCRNMAKKAWKNADYKELQINKIKNQWKDEVFRNKVINSSKRRMIQITEENPNYMKGLAEKAALIHRVNWKNADYKENIVRNKVLRYVNRLVGIVGEENINENNYERYRTNNCFPRFENALKYFKDTPTMIVLAKEYNHYAVSITVLNYTEDVYDLTVDGYHNFLLDCGVFVHNSVDGDPPAAYRYTESKLQKIANEMLGDIDKETVDFIPNYDGSTEEPKVLPAKLPNLLVNGSSGIAVGMATNIPPHNVNEIIDASIALIDKKDITDEEILTLVKGPDFPTGAQIIGSSGIRQAYKTGKGKVTVRSKCQVVEKQIIITEIPYQLNKSLLVEEIAQLVKDKVIEGVSDLRDESDRDGMRIVLDLKRDVNGETVLNQLYKNSQLQTTFGMNMIALVGNQPKLLTLREFLGNYLSHRREVVTRRTRFELRKAEERDHVLQGLLIALSAIDAIIQLIKTSQDVETARAGLITNYVLTEIQANAILDMKLSKLAALEQKKLSDEHNELLQFITEMQTILASIMRIDQIIKDELISLKNEYGDVRKTVILPDEGDFESEDLVPAEEVVISLTNAGYIKRISLDEYTAQRRGGKGIIGTETKEEDFVEQVMIVNTHDTLLCFTKTGMIHWVKAYQVPSAGRYARGTAIANLLSLEKDERVTATIPVKEFTTQDYLMMVTKKGIIKKTQLSEFARPRRGGIIAITLKEDDSLVTVKKTDGTKQLMIATKDGRAVRFKAAAINETGRSSQGVRAIKVKDSEVVGMEIADAPYLLTITEKGYGKRSDVNDYRLINRGGSGVINLKITEKNGPVAAIRTVNNRDEILCMTMQGKTIRVYVKDISVLGRNTQGVRIVRLDEGDKAIAVARIINEEELSGHREEFKPSDEEAPSTPEENGNGDATEEAEMQQNTEISEPEGSQESAVPEEKDNIDQQQEKEDA